MSARRLHLWLLGLVPAIIIVSLLPPSASSASSAYPRVMAATGDSITRAFDVNWYYFLRDGVEYSWSTGTNPAVNSHYQRLLAVDPKLAGNAYNDARRGARMSDLGGQLAAGASQRAGYVTILMGANDVCTSSISTMTPTATFETQFKTALGNFVAARPSARVFVSSIPDIYRLWSILHDNLYAAGTWNLFNICQSMLSASNTEQQRQQVVAQEKADNDALARVCHAFRQCRWDNYAVYNTAFSTADVSTVDYFHPSVTGQKNLAAVTWAASYFATVG
jgi:lysophospholipase L1-like esterase